MELDLTWEALKEMIAANRALLTFLSIAIIYIVLTYVDSRLPPPPPPRPRSPEPVGEITEEELRAHDGSDRKKPLLIAIKSQIYDVSSARGIYGPGQPYSVYLGRDASRAFAKFSFEEEDISGEISDLDPEELKALENWESKISGRYTKVGTIKKSVTTQD